MKNVVIPHDGVSETRSRIERFYPSSGPTGSCYQTSDGQVYVRTPWGNMRVGNDTIGNALMTAQVRSDWYKKRHRNTVTKMAGAFIVGLVVGLLAVLLPAIAQPCGPYLINHF